MSKKKRKPGTGKSPKPGSGLHARDQKWREAGYLTLREAASQSGLSVKAMRNRIADGRWREGEHFVKALKTTNGPVYVAKAVVEELSKLVVQPPAPAAP